MRLVVVAVLLVSSIAGCSEDAPAGPVEPVASQEAAPAIGHFEDSFALIAMDVSVGGQHLTASQESDNCVLLDDAARILSGTATVAWDSSPAAPMDLILWIDDSHKVFVTGGSPLTLDLAGFEVGVDGPSMLSWQVAQDAPAGAAVMTEGTMALSFDYEFVGEDDRMMPDSGWTCVAER